MVDYDLIFQRVAKRLCRVQNGYVVMRHFQFDERRKCKNWCLPIFIKWDIGHYYEVMAYIVTAVITWRLKG